MNPRFTDLFVQRPVLALVLSAVMLLVGIQAGTQLSLRQYPEVGEERHLRQTPCIRVLPRTPCRGSLPRRCSAALQRPKASSSSRRRAIPAFREIEANVRLGENSTEVLTEVITKVNEARFELPRDVEDPVVTQRHRRRRDDVHGAPLG